MYNKNHVSITYQCFFSILAEIYEYKLKIKRIIGHKVNIIDDNMTNEHTKYTKCIRVYYPTCQQTLEVCLGIIMQ